jgi:hypothetical protein
VSVGDYRPTHSLRCDIEPSSNSECVVANPEITRINIKVPADCFVPRLVTENAVVFNDFQWVTFHLDEKLAWSYKWLRSAPVLPPLESVSGISGASSTKKDLGAGRDESSRNDHF